MINNITENQDLVKRQILTGERKGERTGYASIDKPWLKNYPEKAVIEKTPTGSMYDYLYSCISGNPDYVLIDFLGRKITVKEILNKINEQEEYFKSIGIKKGSVVALALANQPEAIYNIYALNKIGAIPCNIDPRGNEKDIAGDLEKSGARDFIGITGTCSIIKNISKYYHLNSISIISPLESAPNKGKVKVVKGLLNFKEFMHGNYRLNKVKKEGRIEINNINDTSLDKAEELAVIVHTGGTTGNHKGVYISNKAINSTVAQHDYLMGSVVPQDTLMNPLPTFMSYGMTTMHLCLCKNLCMYMMPVSSPKTFGKELKRLQPSVIYGGPIHYLTARKSKDLNDGTADLSNTKIAVSGGEITNIQEEKKNNEFYGNLGFQDDIFNGYGASEMCGVFSVKQGRKNSAGSVGYPLPKNNVKIVDQETGEELKYGTGEIGEILLTGESLMLKYDNKEETEKSIKDGWFISGDLGYMNEEGELFITGRKKRQFVSGVDKVYCPKVEEAIESLSMIEKCVVVGIKDNELRKVPYAFIQLKDEYKDINADEIIAEEIRKKVKSSLNEFSVPKYFDFEGKIKYTSQGKIDFITLEKEAEDKIFNKKEDYQKIKR